jgi:hypothetical protein
MSGVARHQAREAVDELHTWADVVQERREIPRPAVKDGLDHERIGDNGLAVWKRRMRKAAQWKLWNGWENSQTEADYDGRRNEIVTRYYSRPTTSTTIGMRSGPFPHPPRAREGDMNSAGTCASLKPLECGHLASIWRHVKAKPPAHQVPTRHPAGRGGFAGKWAVGLLS